MPQKKKYVKSNQSNTHCQMTRNEKKVTKVKVFLLHSGFSKFTMKSILDLANLLFFFLYYSRLDIRFDMSVLNKHIWQSQTIRFNSNGCHFFLRFILSTTRPMSIACENLSNSILNCLFFTDTQHRTYTFCYFLQLFFSRLLALVSLANNKVGDIR